MWSGPQLKDGGSRGFDAVLIDLSDRICHAGEVMITSAKVKVFRSAVLVGSSKIRIRHRSVVMDRALIRADLAIVSVGSNCVVGEDSIIRPAMRKYKDGFVFCPVSVGDNVYIGPGSTISCASIGNGTHIGRGAFIGKRCVIEENVIVEDGAVVPPDTTLMPNSVYGGHPAVRLGDIPACYPALHKEWLHQYYESLILTDVPSSKEPSAS